MSQNATVAPVQRSVTVAATPERAFEVFTAGFASWWPSSHSVIEGGYEGAYIEPHEGGRWYERSKTGVEEVWGRVLVYEPPHRIVLTWQITPDFAPEPDPAKASEVDVRFFAEDEQRTRVEIEHRSLERHGEGWERMRAAVDSPGGWPGELQRFAAVATG